MLSTKKKGPRKPPKSIRASLEPAQADAEPQQINLLDSAAVKRELDEATVRAAKEAGFQEDHYVSNVKISLGLITCCIALIAQFYPRKHPDNWWLLMCCVVAYAACTAALNLFLLRFEGETFFFTRPKQDIPALKFVARMPRYSDKYTLLISKREDRDQPNSTFQLMPWLSVLRSSIPGLKSDSIASHSAHAEMTNSVTKYFHSDGYLNNQVFGQDVQSALNDPVLRDSRKQL